MNKHQARFYPLEQRRILFWWIDVGVQDASYTPLNDAISRAITQNMRARQLGMRRRTHIITEFGLVARGKTSVE